MSKKSNNVTLLVILFNVIGFVWFFSWSYSYEKHTFEIDSRDTMLLLSLATANNYGLSAVMDLAGLYSILAKNGGEKVNSYVKCCVSHYDIPLYFILLDSVTINDTIGYCHYRIIVGNIRDLPNISDYKPRHVVLSLDALALLLVKRDVNYSYCLRHFRIRDTIEIKINLPMAFGGDRLDTNILGYERDEDCTCLYIEIAIGIFHSDIKIKPFRYIRIIDD